MSQFEDLIQESFGTSSHIDVSDMRRLYYGRPNVYVDFTNEGDIDTEHNDLPDSMICYDIKDVVGRKIQSYAFYARIFRINISGKRFLSDVRRYRKEDLKRDVSDLRRLGWIEEEKFDSILRKAISNVRNRHQFEVLWEITRNIGRELSERNYREMWRDILLSLGYAGFSNPSRTNMLGGRDTRTLYLDYDRREDLDILPIQKYRSDPRRRIENNVDRMRKRMRGARNRVAKERT